MSLKEIFSAVRQLGVRNVLKQMWKQSEVRVGTLVGEDRFGNKYYEAPNSLYGRDRWVDLTNSSPDASQIPPEWHGWLHHSNDLPGKDAKSRFTPAYGSEHRPNPTGTDQAYTPPSFLFSKNRRLPRQTVQPWTPGSSSAREENS